MLQEGCDHVCLWVMLAVDSVVKMGKKYSLQVFFRRIHGQIKKDEKMY